MTTTLETAVRQLFADIAGTDSTGDPVIQQPDVLNVLEEIRQHIENLELMLMTRDKDAARWNIIKNGLFVSAPNEHGDIEVVYQNAWMDEVATEIYDSLPKTDIQSIRRKGSDRLPWSGRPRPHQRIGIVRDITPVVDHALQIQTEERAERIMKLITKEVVSNEN